MKNILIITLLLSLNNLSRAEEEFESYCNSVIEPICVAYDDHNYDCDSFSKVTCEDIEDQRFSNEPEMKSVSEKIKQSFINGGSAGLQDSRFKIGILKHLVKNNSKK